MKSTWIRVLLGKKRAELRKKSPAWRMNFDTLEDRSVPAALEYVNAAWSGFALGAPIADADLGTPGNQPATFGTDAFDTINGALAVVDPNGSVIVNAGTYNEAVSLSAGNAATTQLTITNNAAVALNNLAGATTSGVVLASGSTLTVNELSSSTYDGLITGAGSLVINSPTTNTLTLTNAGNTYSGGTNLAGGRLAVANTSAIGSGTLSFTSPTGTRFTDLNAANDTLANNIVLGTPASGVNYEIRKASFGGNINLAGVISGGNSNVTLFMNAGTGGDNTTTYSFSGANTFTAGRITLNRGGLIVNNVSGLGNASNLVFLDPNNNTTLGDLRFNVGGTFANPIQFVSTTAINPLGNTVVLTGNMSGGESWQAIGTGGGGTGTLILDGATYTNSGTITVQAGATLQVGNSDAAGSLGTGSVVNNGTLKFKRTDSFSFNNLISGTGSVVQAGSGTLTPTNAANSYTGATTISAGTLAVSGLANGGANSVIGASTNAAGNLVISGGGTLAYTAVASTTSTDRNITLGVGGGTISAVDAGSTVTIGGYVTLTNPELIGQSPLTIGGAGKVSFTANDALSNIFGDLIHNVQNVNINSGTLRVQDIILSKFNNLNIAAGAFVESAGQLSTTADGPRRFNAQVIGQGLLKLVSTTNDGVSTFDLNFNYNDVTGSTANWGSAITSNIDLGSSQRYIAGRSNHNGFGVYKPATDVYLGPAASFVRPGGDPNNNDYGDTRGGGSGIISGTGGLTFIPFSASRNDLPEVPIGIYGANTFTGPVVIKTGSIYLVNPNAINGNALSFDVPAGRQGNLFLYGNNVTVSNLSSTGLGLAQIANGNQASDNTGIPGATLTVAQNIPGTFNGVLLDYKYEYSSGGANAQGPLSFTKLGPASLTLAPAAAQNVYSGTTTVSAGTLVVNNAINTATDSGTGASVVVVNGGTLTGNGSVNGTVEIDAGGVVNGTLYIPGAITVNAGGNASGSIGTTGGVTVNPSGLATYTPPSNIVIGSPPIVSSPPSAVIATGTVSPADSPNTGILYASGLNLSSGTFVANLNGPAAGSGYDQIVSTGPVNITGATLSATANYQYAANSVVSLIQNTGGPITGQFVKPGGGVYAEGDTINIGGQNFTLSYIGGASSNDVTLTKQAVPVKYVSSTWAGFANGTPIADADLVAAGNQPATFGTTAFASINAAVAASSPASLIIVNSGTYAEAALVNKAVSVVFQSGPVTINSLADTVSNASFNISTDALLNPITLTIGNATSTTISSPIVGVGNLVKVGSGTVTFGGSNQTIGTTTISDGVFKLASGSALSAVGSGLIVNSPGVLRLNGFNAATGTLSGTGTVENASATAATLSFSTVGAASFSGLIQNGVGGGALSIVQSGSGQTTLSNTANTYTGSTSVLGGTLVVSTLANGGAPSSIGASSSAAGNLVLASGATISYTGGSATIDRGLTLTGNNVLATFNIATPGTTLTTSGLLSGGAVGFDKNGPGTLYFSTNNAVSTGNIFIDGGALGVANFTTNVSRVVNIGTGAFLDSYGQLSTTADPNLTGSTTPQVTGDGTLRLVSTTNDGVNSFDLNFNSNDIPGSTANWGTSLNSKIDLGSSQRYFTGKSNHNGFGVYWLNTDAAITGSIIGSGGITWNAPPSGRSDMEVPLGLFGANTFTGPLVIKGGSVYLASSLYLSTLGGSGSSLNGNVVTFDVPAGRAGNLFLYGGNATISNLSSIGAGTARIANGNQASGAGGATVAVPAATLTLNQTTNGAFSGLITDYFYEYDNGSNPQGTLSVVKTGTATLSLTGANTYSGVTTVSDGTLSVPSLANGGQASPIGSSTSDPANLIIGNGVLNISGLSTTTDRGFTQSSSASGGVGVSIASSIVTFAGGSTGSGAFTKSGPGALVLSNNTYTGSVSVAAGTLAGTGSNTAGTTTVTGKLNPGSTTAGGFFNSGTLSFGLGGTLSINFNGATGGPVAGTDYDQVVVNGSVNLANSTLQLLPGSTTAAIGDQFTIISGATALSGTFNVGGSQVPQNGFVFVSGQTFQVNYLGGAGHDVVLTRVQPQTYYVDDNWVGLANGTPIADADPVAPGNQAAVIGTSAFASPNAAIAAAIPNSAIIVNSGAYSENVIINKVAGITLQQGPITFGSLASNQPLASIDNQGVAFTFGNATSTQFDAQFFGSGSITLVGSGTFTVTNTNPYAGSTNVNGGKLVLSISSALASSPLSIASGGEVVTNALNVALNNVTVNAGGTLTLNGYSLTLASLAGTGTVQNASATPVTLTLTPTGTSVFGGVLQDGAGGGALSLVVNGTGELDLTGTASTYTGSTTLAGGTLGVQSLAPGGSPSSIGASSNAASNLVIQNNTTFNLIAVGSTSTTDRNLTIGGSAVNIGVTDAGSTLSFSGVINGGTTLFNKIGSGTLAFTNNSAFGTPTNLLAYGSVTTGDIHVFAGNLQTGYLRLNRGRDGGKRNLAIDAGASVTATGTVDIDNDQSVYVTQVAGPGTLKLRNPNPTAASPSISSDAGPSGGDGGPWGAVISAVVDVGTGNTQIATGKTDRNDITRYAGDLRFDNSIVGSAGFQFIGLNVNGGRDMNFVLNADNSGFTGAVFIANSDLILTNANSLSSANSVTFNSTLNQNTANKAILFLFGHDATIGSLNDVSAAGTLSYIRNGSRPGLPNGGTGVNNNSAALGVALGIDANATLTIVQTTSGVFNGTIDDGPNDNGTGDGGTYNSIAIVKQGSGSLSLTGASTYTGGTTVTAGTLAVNNISGSGTGTGNVSVTGGAIGGSGTISGTVTVTAASVAPGNGPGTLSVGGNVSLDSASFYSIDLASPVSYDSLNVIGSVDLNSNSNAAGGAKLNINAANAAVSSGTIYTIVSAGGVTGTLRNYNGTSLTDGTSFVTASGVGLTIHYTATTVTLTVNGPTVTGVAPFSGPTTGGQTVIITGTNFGAVSGTAGVQFGLGANAASYTVLSNSSIQAVTPAHAVGTVDVLVTNNGQTSAVNAADRYTFNAVPPTFSALVVNGGDMYTVDAFGQKPTALVGNNSIVEQLYVTFNIGVTLAPGAFRLDAGTVTQSIPSSTPPVTSGLDVAGIIAEPDASTLDVNGGYKGYRLRFDATVSGAHPNAANYVNIIDNTFAAGNISTTLKDGYYKLTTIGANVHAGNSVAGTAMAGNNVQGVWTLFGSVDSASHSATTNNSNDGSSFATIGQPDLDAMLATVGSSREFANPPYNANLDFDLSGDIGQVDLDAFIARFGSEWLF